MEEEKNRWMTEKRDAMIRTMYQAWKTITLNFFKQMKQIPVSEFQEEHWKTEAVYSCFRGKYIEKKQADYALQGQQKSVQVGKVNNLLYGLHSHKNNINTKY